MLETKLAPTSTKKLIKKTSFCEKNLSISTEMPLTNKIRQNLTETAENFRVKINYLILSFDSFK